MQIANYTQNTKYTFWVDVKHVLNGSDVFYYAI